LQWPEYPGRPAWKRQRQTLQGEVQQPVLTSGPATSAIEPTQEELVAVVTGGAQLFEASHCPEAHWMISISPESQTYCREYRKIDCDDDELGKSATNLQILGRPAAHDSSLRPAVRTAARLDCSPGGSGLNAFAELMSLRR